MMEEVDDMALRFDVSSLKFNEDGLIPAIIQDVYTSEVLMLAYMNLESLHITLDEGRTCFWSRSRQSLWRKGATSGSIQRVVDIAVDCDGDALLVKVETDGRPACHTGARTCFNSENSCEPNAGILAELYRLVSHRKTNPVEGSYTSYLFTKGQDKILKKVGEECSEVLIASKNDSEEEIVYEVGDLFYHLMVLLAHHNIDPALVFAELTRRRK